MWHSKISEKIVHKITVPHKFFFILAFHLLMDETHKECQSGTKSPGICITSYIIIIRTNVSIYQSTIDICDK